MMDSGPMGGTRRNGRKRIRGRAGPSTLANDNRGGAVGDPRRRKRRRKIRGDGSNGRDLRAALEPIQDHASVLGSRVVQKRQRERPQGPPDAFGLFCAYHLGVTLDDGYQKPSLDSTARRFGISADEVKNLLKEYAIDHDSIANTDFDLEGARLDVKLAPEGISRTEIARDHFETYLAASGVREDSVPRTAD